MKKVFLSLIALTATATLALAQPAPAAAAASGVAPAAPMAPATSMAAEKALIGTIKSVSMADITKGTKSEIVVSDNSGKTTNVLVKTTTTLYDTNGKAITFDKIIANSKVSVVYTTTAEGVDEAKSVKVVK